MRISDGWLAFYWELLAISPYYTEKISHQTDSQGMKTRCLGTHSGSLNKILAACNRSLDASGDGCSLGSSLAIFFKAA